MDRPGGCTNHCNAKSSICDILHALSLANSDLDKSLPIAPVEPTAIALKPCGVGIGTIQALSCPSVTDLSLTRLVGRVLSGDDAEFLLAPSLRALEADATAMLRITRCYAVLQQSAQILSVTYEAFPKRGGVLLRVHVPAETLDGDHVTITRVSVAGCELPLVSAQLRVTVGYNHKPAAPGPVTAAAKDGDVRALIRCLNHGASTEEVDAVRPGAPLRPPSLVSTSCPVSCRKDPLHCSGLPSMVELT